MLRRISLSSFAIGAILLGGAVHADRTWLAPGDFEQLHLVLGADAPEPEQIAAKRFIAHWKLATGLDISQSAEASGGANVWIGAAGLKAFPDIGGAESDESIVRTEPGALILAGGSSRATLAAEWIFFEKFLGARAFAPGVLQFPKPERGIPEIDWRGRPAFEYRDTNARPFLTDPWFASLNDLNGQWSNVPERFGGHIGFVHGLEGHGHTFHRFVSPDEYFEKHPEYFAEINGERIRESQLCLTNPDVLAITIEKARQFLREAKPGERILSISQMDYFWFDSWCTCTKCRAVDDAEGSHSGTIIRFVNAVADAVKDEFPNARIDTFAYLYSRKPPKLTRPRDNVQVRVCAIEADYGRPLADWPSPDNRAFLRDLKGWLRIAKHVWVWDYTQNWRAFQAPHPNLHVIGPNLRLFARLGVDGVFEQASPFSPASDNEFLKAYLIGRGLRDPKFDWKRETADFLDAYYGAAAPYVAEYQQLLRDRLRASGMPLYFVNDLEWLDADTVERAQGIFARAFDAAPDPAIAERLRAAYLPVQYAALVCPPQVAQTPDAYILTRPPSQTFSEYWRTLQSLGVTHLNDYPIEQLRTRLRGETPPRHEVAPIIKLRSGRYEVWVVPAVGGSIVRWRDTKSGRDWLRGYDDIRATAGRIQDCATADPDRWAEPVPIDARYRLLERTSDSVHLETILANGIVLLKSITLIEDEIDIRLTLTNTGQKSVVPKVAIRSDINARKPARGFPRIDVLSGGSPPLAKEDGMHVDLDRAPLEPHASREAAVRFSISAHRPPAWTPSTPAR